MSNTKTVKVFLVSEERTNKRGNTEMLFTEHKTVAMPTAAIVALAQKRIKEGKAMYVVVIGSKTAKITAEGVTNDVTGSLVKTNK